MVKKIFALVMVMSILGGILAGCSSSEPAAGDSTTTTKPADTAGGTGTDTTATDTTKTGG